MPAAVIKAVSSFYREEGEKDRDNYIETQVLGTLTIVLDTRQFIKQTVIPHHKLKVQISKQATQYIMYKQHVNKD